jgi:magnesium chelatase subunit I
VDEVNLLADHLVDVLLDVAASGINHIERDGISHQHDARFVLVGTMNPEEGELRPQLLDRFGLMIDLPAQLDAETRQQIVRTRLQFDDAPHAFAQRFQSQQQALRQRILEARQRLPELAFSDALHRQVSEICSAANVEGVRADLVLLRAARAHAALQQRNQIEAQDVDAVAEWALAHRRQSAPAGRHHHPLPEQNPSKEHSSASAGAQTSSSGFADTSTQQPENTWGALAPESIPIQPVKSVRPLPLKKP